MERFREAFGDLDEAQTLAERFGMRLHEADCALERTWLNLSSGRADDAVRSFERAQGLVGETQYLRRTGVLNQLAQQVM